MPKRLVSCLVLMLLLLAGAATASVRLPAMFSDNLVLQQGKPLPVWGWADDGEEITVRFRGRSEQTVAHNLRWRVNLPPQEVGAPTILEVRTRRETLVFTNVVVGEVWICSGQSNMELPLSNCYESAADIASATNANIRLFNVWKNRMSAPTTYINSAWKVASPQEVRGFSGVAYYFGRALHESRQIPVGLIGTYWGATPAEAWMSRAALESNPRYVREILEPAPAATETWREAMCQFRQEQAEAAAGNRKFTRQAPRQPWEGGELFNGMIAPLVPYAIAGAIWYQGEANAARAEQYRTLFPDLIRCWRHEWGQGDFPFLCVQLAPWDRNKHRSLEEITREPAESDWAELREAQGLARKTLPAVGMAVITDLGAKDDIHPRQKRPVGERLALAARAIAYGEPIEFSGPLFREAKVAGNAIELRFEHAGQGLEARGGPLKGFAICGEDRRFIWAEAEIHGEETVVVHHPAVSQAVAVRYGWADYPVANLYNKEGLPASPFRTDDFPLTTAPADAGKTVVTGLLRAPADWARTNRWDPGRAAAWFTNQSLPMGFNYIPANAISYTEMWMDYAFDPALIDRELALAQPVGFNCLRVVLPYVVWEAEPAAFKARFETFLSLCQKRGLKVIPCFFDDCVFGSITDPEFGRQPEVLPGWYANGWTPSPGHKRVCDSKVRPSLERYVKDVMQAHRSDPRILCWDLYNEPGNSGMGDSSFSLLTEAFGWARQVNPEQPVTSGIWGANPRINSFLRAESDIITFHNYRPAAELREQIHKLKTLGRPIIATEWLNRGRQSLVQTCLPVLLEEHVGALHWGLVNGKTQTHLPWGHRPGDPEPKVWQHDLFHPDHSPYAPVELELFRKALRLGPLSSTRKPSTLEYN